MRIGVLSDSHGRVAQVRAALAVFDRLDVRMIVHCGDVGGMAVFDEMVGRDCRFVWGNTDAADQSLRAYLATTGLPSPDTVPLEFTVAGRVVQVFHGHEPEFPAALRRGGPDYILHGHTHVPRDERIGRTRVINPGALHRAHVHTVAVLDPVNDTVEFHELAT